MFVLWVSPFAQMVTYLIDWPNTSEPPSLLFSLASEITALLMLFLCNGLAAGLPVNALLCGYNNTMVSSCCALAAVDAISLVARQSL